MFLLRLKNVGDFVDSALRTAIHLSIFLFTESSRRMDYSSSFEGLENSALDILQTGDYCFTSTQVIFSRIPRAFSRTDLLLNFLCCSEGGLMGPGLLGAGLLGSGLLGGGLMGAGLMYLSNFSSLYSLDFDR